MKMTIIGCGNMGAGLAMRLSTGCKLYLYDRNIEKAKKLEQDGYGKACSSIKEAVTSSEVIILAVKPQNVQEAAGLLGKHLKADQILVSLLTGISLKALKGFFSQPLTVRMMPNLSIICGEGVIGLSCDEHFSQKNKSYITKLFENLGKIYWLPEDKINALTALTGSGPAFFFAMIEAMIDAGIAMGFNAKDAKELVIQMLQGSLTLLEKTEKHPGELKWQIASPQGTTIAGIKKLEESACRGGIMNTFLAAFERANELGG